MNSNSENKIETIEQFREWYHNLGEIQLSNGQIYKPFGPNGEPEDPQFTPEDEVILFNTMPIGTTESEWFKNLKKFIDKYTESDIDYFYDRYYK